MIGAIQNQMWQLRPDQPIEDIASMETVIGGARYPLFVPVALIPR